MFSMTLLFLVFLVDVSDASSAFNVKWNYVRNTTIGPANWTNHFSKCSGSSQSPINIEIGKAKYNESLKPLALGNYKNSDKLLGFSLALTNGEYSVKVLLKRSNSVDNSPVTIVHEGITWRFVQFHFHWGSVDTQGSEHTIDGKEYPAEMHMIHYNTKYSSFANAASQPDGLLVWGHLFEVVSSPTNVNMQKVITYFNDVRLAGETKTLPNFPLSSLIPHAAEEAYYTYRGSLTTPACDETVKWIVSSKIISITSTQLAEFRKLRESSNNNVTTVISDNYRPVQALNGRLVEKSFGNTSTSCGMGANIFVILISLLAFINM